VALVASARRELLLRVHRHRLRREDLEDCFSQATLELVVHARGGGRFAGRAHITNTLEQRFLSRIYDRRRALGGRSPMQAALEGALSLAGEQRPVDVADPRAEPERMAFARHDLERLRTCASQLTADQRLVLACQVALQMECGEFCRRYGWKSEKYRKVAQRGRARLRELMASDGWGEASQGQMPAQPATSTSAGGCAQG
jgi:DNA-directed RNA polymerase specialized sigma24 family protein